MQKSLHITDKQYLVALTAFFFPYALLDVGCFSEAPINKYLTLV